MGPNDEFQHWTMVSGDDFWIVDLHPSPFCAFRSSRTFQNWIWWLKSYLVRIGKNFIVWIIIMIFWQKDVFAKSCSAITLCCPVGTSEFVVYFHVPYRPLYQYHWSSRKKNSTKQFLIDVERWLKKYNKIWFQINIDIRLSFHKL